MFKALNSAFAEPGVDCCREDRLRVVERGGEDVEDLVFEFEFEFEFEGQLMGFAVGLGLRRDGLGWMGWVIPFDADDGDDDDFDGFFE